MTVALIDTRNDAQMRAMQESIEEEPGIFVPIHDLRRAIAAAQKLSPVRKAKEDGS